ncbi:beta-mannosidase [Catenuloplanes nepalensis]|uniref:beta-mannosidase n=1 Tax=Catenuloplanes nepalensis TaxID=587533 RepID=A0ABT9MRR8_9ACTN|nr:glycoside hydrolase family 2 protein [Catenuloplanes nepalensis]MDP9794135.1 beta-mannosidase [Catenuloplanes nepalensis]
MYLSRDLHQGWTVRAADEQLVPAVPARVPGCVHTDLLAAGLIPDPLLDDNEQGLSWIGRTEWVYETFFDAPPDGAAHVDLVAEGLDTVATVLLNGAEIGRTANMHRSYRIGIDDVLRASGNVLTIRFHDAYAYAESVRDLVGERPNAYDEPFQYIRKMACNFGWDWGPTVVTAGIWQPIRLSTWSTARLDVVRPLVTVDDGTGRVTVHATVARDGDAPLTLTAAIGPHRRSVSIRAGESAGDVSVEVPDVRRWWPRGHGEQHRYDLEVTLTGPGGEPLDRYERAIGFRTVELDTAEDADGRRFVLRVNDRDIFVRGVNWIPEDAFVTRVSRTDYAHRLEQACDAGVNYLRVWGGGRYESDDFYDLADELGLLVGQDFLFACAAYPEEDPIGAEVEAEAAEQVVRLMSHPSLVMWVGNNENIWGWHDWQWQEKLAGRTWGRGFYLDLLPRTVAALDPARPYWPGSPYSGDEEHHPNDPARGTMHIWTVWNTDDYTHYGDYRPRFVAEFGFQGPPAYATLRRAVSDEPLTPDSPGVLHHQKADDGNGKLLRGLAGHLPEPHGFDDWHWATQLNQARAIRFGVEHFRSLRPLCTGTILWQLNDNWPVTSWAAIDGDGRRKPLWYALRAAYADRLLTVQPRDGAPAVVAVNDGAEVWRDELRIRRVTLDGSPRGKLHTAIEVPPGGVVTVPLPPEVAAADDPAAELIVVDADGAGRATRFFAEDVAIAYPRPAFDAVVRPEPDGASITVTARTLLRDLTLFPDRVDASASADDALVTLLPGESATLRVRAAAPLDDERLTRRPVLRFANDLLPG